MFCRNGVSPTLAAFYSKAQIDPALHQVDLKRGGGEESAIWFFPAYLFFFFIRHDIQFQRSKVTPALTIGSATQAGFKAEGKKELLLTPPLVHQPDVFTQKRDYFFRVSQLESRLAEYRR